MKNRFSYLLFVLSATMIVSLIVSNIIAGKLWAAPFGIVLTAGVVLFPIVYILGDVIPEVYGYATARRVILTGFALNLFAVFFFWITLKMAYPPFFEGQTAFQTVLGFTPRLLVASLVAYLIGTNANALVLVQVKKLTHSRYLWVRTISSTIVGEGLDSIIFMTLAFYGIVPNAQLPVMILSQAGFKIAYEVLATPLTYLVVGWVKKHEDKGVNNTFNYNMPPVQMRKMPYTKE